LTYEAGSMGLEVLGLLLVFGDVRLQKPNERSKAGFAGFVCSCFTHWRTLDMRADTLAHEFELGCMAIFKRLLGQRKEDFRDIAKPLRSCGKALRSLTTA
jgi:hypothetical protein